MEQRGLIYNQSRARQQNDFSGLLFGKITPTDIDGVIEYKNKAWFLIEVKFGDAQMPYGQQLALERFVDDMEAAGKKAVCLVATHNTPAETDINTAECIVTSYRMNKKWGRLTKPATVYQAIKSLIRGWNLDA